MNTVLVEMFGKIVDLLAAHGLLSADDIIRLTDQQHSVTLAELLPGDGA